MSAWLTRSFSIVFAALFAPLLACHESRPDERPNLVTTQNDAGSASANQVVVISFHAYVLRSKEWPAANCIAGFEGQVPQLLESVNRIWSVAGVRFRLDEVAVVEANMDNVRSDLVKLDASMRARPSADLLARAIPISPRLEQGLRIYFAHQFDANGAVSKDGATIVSDTPQLRRVDGGTDQPTVRVMGHMVGAMLGLSASDDETNLMAAGTTGTHLDSDQIERVHRTLASDAITRSPPAADFLVIPLRAYVLKSDIRALNASPDLLRDLPRIVRKVNRVWSAAGIYFQLDDAAIAAVDDVAAHQAFARRDPLAQSKPPLDLLPLVIPTSTRTADGLRIYYVHDFVANGVYLKRFSMG